jgi:aspartate-semialdehyde dehydrogenase
MADAPIALVGGDSLLGADVRERLAGELRGVKVKLVGADVEDGAVLTEQGGEAVLMTGLDEETLNAARVVILAGSAEAGQKAFRLLKGNQVVVDLTGAIEDLPQARLRAPWIEAERGVVPQFSTVQVLAHPAAIVLGKLLCHCTRNTRAVVTALVPASELGKAAVTELQHQTLQLLTFKPLVKKVFGEQLSFNLLVGGMRALEERIEKHLASFELLATVRAVQAPVMHGYGFSVWLDGGTADLRGLDVWADDPPAPVGVAGQDGMSIGRVEEGWLWVAADQYRVTAENALELVKAAL